MSSALAGLAAGLALIAYGEGVFDATPAAAAKIAHVAPPEAREAASSAAMSPQRQSPQRVPAAKKRPGTSKRATGVGPAGTSVRPTPNVRKPPRRNFLGLRTVAGWITRGAKSNTPDERGR